jgi:hypothetical protein
MLKKYPKLRYPTHKQSRGVFADGTIFVQEKLDGANFRFGRECHLDEQFQTEDRDLVFGSRNVIYKNKEDESKQFKHAIDAIREQVSDGPLEVIENTVGGPVTIFGEAMHPHTLQYDFDNAPSFVGFDIWSHSDNRFLPVRDVEHYLGDVFGLDTAPILDQVSADDWDEYEADVPQSAYGNVRAEGLVLKNPVTDSRCKMVREDFKEKNKQTFGKSKNQQSSGAEKLSYQYIPNARIEKQVHKLIDEGDWDSMKMEMMEELPTAVIEDMADEEGTTIFLEENWEIDTHEFRSVTSSRCALLLRKMINETQFKKD